MSLRRIAASVAVAVMIASGVSLVTAPASSAGTTGWAGTLGSEIMESWSADATTCPTPGFESWRHYNVQSFSVSSDGDYTLAIESAAGMGTSPTGTLIAVYEDSFDSSAWLTNCIGYSSSGSLPNSAGASLQAGRTYFAVVLNLQGWNDPLDAEGEGGTFSGTISGPGTVTFDALMSPDTYVPIPPWVQGYGRHSQADLCLDGWTASWEQWPHGGSGGWVCTREIPSLG